MCYNVINYNWTKCFSILGKFHTNYRRNIINYHDIMFGLRTSITKSTIIKSSLALVIEQLLLLDPFWDAHFVVLSLVSLSLFPLLLSVVTAVIAVFVLGSTSDIGGGDVCLGVNSELNGTSGITRSSSLTMTGLFITNAPTLMVSLRDFDVSSLHIQLKALLRYIFYHILSNILHLLTFADIVYDADSSLNENDRS